jgi:MFS family permease
MRHYKAVPIVCLLLALAAIIALGFWADRMTPLTFEVLAFLLGVGFGPTAPLTQVALQNTVASHHFGTAIGTMNFSRNLFSTILVAVFGAIVLAGVSVVEPVGSVGGLRTLTATSPQVFAHVFYTAAATLVIALVSMILLEEKPLLASLPAGEDLRARGAAPGD